MALTMKKNNLLSIAATLSFAVLFSYTASVSATVAALGRCKIRDITISQSQDGTYPNGIPKFRVEISNTCTNPNCTISNILVHCGQFASARLVSPLEFRRIRNDICLVNNGEPLSNFRVVAFSYGNTRDYPLSVASADITC